MSSTMRNVFIATTLTALFAGSVFAEESTTPAMSQERVQQRLNEQTVEAENAKAREQVRTMDQQRTEQQTQNQERLQLRLSEQAVEAERAKAREQVRNQERVEQKAMNQQHLQQRLNEKDVSAENAKARNSYREQSSERRSERREMPARSMGR